MPKVVKKASIQQKTVSPNDDNRNKVHILIVDDEADIRDTLSRHFRFLGYQVDTAENGVKALEQMRLKSYYVVVSDIMMPEMDGVDLLRHVRKEYPMTHVVMITGYVTMENILSCMRHGADTCVFKPLTDITELESAVVQAVNCITSWRNKLKQLTEMRP